MHKTLILPVNSQEGLIISEDYKTIFAFYSHHNTIIIAQTPWDESDFEIPENLSSYEVSRCTHISLMGWTNDGERSANWFKGINRNLTKKKTK